MKVDDFSWHLKSPIGKVFHDKIPSWLMALRSFRGQVLYEDGLRPYFRLGEEVYEDNCEADFYSFHLIAKKNDEIAGSVRITPLLDHLCSSSSDALGKEVFSDLLDKNGYVSQKLAEIGRWTVSKKYKNTFLGFFLGLHSIDFANSINLKSFANGGKKAQHMMSLFGGKLFSLNPGPYFIPKYNDEIFFIDIDIDRAPKKVQRLIQSYEIMA